MTEVGTEDVVDQPREEAVTNCDHVVRIQSDADCWDWRKFSISLPIGGAG